MKIKNQAPPKLSFRKKTAIILFGLFFLIIIFEIGLRIGGFVILSLQEYKNRLSLKQKGAYRIMCLGESTTQNQYPRFLEETFNQRNTGIKFSVIDKGLVGANTEVILSVLEENLDKYKPDMVVTMMGVNDKGVYAPYQVTLTSKISLFFKSFRAYKLSRLLWLHILTKAEETGFYKPRNKQPFSKTMPSFLMIESKEDFTEEKKSVLQDESANEAAELSPKSDSEYVKLGGFYREQQKHKEAEQAFKKAVELNPKNDSAYRGLARVYKEQGRYGAAEDILKKAIEFNPRNDSAYNGLGLLYKVQSRLIEAEAAFKKAIELNPSEYQGYLGLGWLYKVQSRLIEAEAAFKKAIELNPSEYQGYLGLGWLYIGQIRITEAEQIFKKPIELNLDNGQMYVGLGTAFIYQHRFTEAEEAFKKAIEFNPNNGNAYGGLETVYLKIGNNKLIEEYMEKVEQLNIEHYNVMIVNNYLRLKQILDQRNVRLVCVQYPMCNIEPLKGIFKDQYGIIFVDNEKIFKDAVKRDGYNMYFNDMFAGNFGHCTPKGNQLLAKNIADVILKEVFGR